MLPFTCPDVYEKFCEGFITFQKTNTEFSTIALDQVHEQNNKDIKGVGGAVNLVNRADESSLIRWELCGHEVATLISDFENDVQKNESGTKI